MPLRSDHLFSLYDILQSFFPTSRRKQNLLRSLLRKNQPFIWGEAQEKSFQKLNQLVAQATTLAYFRRDCNTRIIADAGPQGLGAVLTQLQDGEWRAIKRVKPPTGPWQDIAIDLMGPPPTGESLLVVVDYYSRFYEVAIMNSTAAKRVVDVLT